ncbi:hypothetical protein UVI_02060710 [Ustilaginoidea virens]|uniref:Uncharacterized protein n=1 Tax=Ustilaginoidea virens TaxID=1159556 RepID=A0A1B5L8L6_USTVR|nr:hypothetical protein UVI_02060710 [Ustilaginoidea virens]
MTESEGTDPLKVTCPKVWYFARIVFRSRNAIAFSNDVFPLPDGPMMTLSTPARKVVVIGAVPLIEDKGKPIQTKVNYPRLLEYALCYLLFSCR